MIMHSDKPGMLQIDSPWRPRAEATVVCFPPVRVSEASGRDPQPLMRLSMYKVGFSDDVEVRLLRRVLCYLKGQKVDYSAVDPLNHLEDPTS